MLKHVIVERPLPGRVDEFVTLARELWDLMAEREWQPYRAWPVVAGDEGEPGLFDVGVLGRARRPDGVQFVLECEFPDRQALEGQLTAMRTDVEVVKIILAAAELLDRDASRAYVLQDWATSAYNPDRFAPA